MLLKVEGSAKAPLPCTKPDAMLQSQKTNDYTLHMLRKPYAKAALLVHVGSFSLTYAGKVWVLCKCMWGCPATLSCLTIQILEPCEVSVQDLERMLQPV